MIFSMRNAFIRFIWMLLLSMAGGLLLELAGRPENRFGFMMASIVEKAIGIYILSGIFPVLVWVWQRFVRKVEPRGIFLGWGLIMVAFFFFSYIGERYDQEKMARDAKITSTDNETEASMTFSQKGNGGSCSVCGWTSATGVIDSSTPVKFLEYLRKNPDPGTIFLDSPGGSLFSGMELVARIN